jgi:hypothetical protein
MAFTAHKNDLFKRGREDLGVEELIIIKKRESIWPGLNQLMKKCLTVNA